MSAALHSTNIIARSRLRQISSVPRTRNPHDFRPHHRTPARSSTVQGAARWLFFFSTRTLPVTSLLRGVPCFRGRPSFP